MSDRDRRGVEDGVEERAEIAGAIVRDPCCDSQRGRRRGDDEAEVEIAQALRPPGCWEMLDDLALPSPLAFADRARDRSTRPEATRPEVSRAGVR